VKTPGGTELEVAILGQWSVDARHIQDRLDRDLGKLRGARRLQKAKQQLDFIPYTDIGFDDREGGGLDQRHLSYLARQGNFAGAREDASHSLLDFGPGGVRRRRLGATP